MVEQALQPVRLMQHGVRAEHEQIVAVGVPGGEVLRAGFAARLGQRIDAQLVAAQLAHRGKPGAGVHALTGIVDDQHFVMKVGGVTKQAFYTALQCCQLIPRGNDHRYQRAGRMPVFDPVQQWQLIMMNDVLSANARKMGRYHRLVMLDHLRQRQPLREGQGRLHLNLGDVLDGLRPDTFHQTPDEIVRRQFAMHRVEAASVQQIAALERQRAANIRIGPHQVQVEIRLEDRLAGFSIDQCALVAVNAQQAFVLRDSLSQHQQ
ncbi:hypothetical protein ALP75_200026 [Pseudomonas syringae pv. actinidiae]|nr:hypothetical protein ALP75_200026 [Pseudomonas syringae pv. actinidiae]